MPAKARRHEDQEYFFIDFDFSNRQIIGSGTETKSNVEVHLSRGYHRISLSRGQQNKLVNQLDEYSHFLRRERDHGQRHTPTWSC